MNRKINKIMVTLNSQQKKLNLTKNKNKGHDQFQLWTTINFRLIDRTSFDGHKYDRGFVTSTGLEAVLAVQLPLFSCEIRNYFN